MSEYTLYLDLPVDQREWFKTTADLLPIGSTEEIIGGFKTPSRLEESGFTPVGFQRSWVKRVGINDRTLEVCVQYRPDAPKPVQRPGFQTEAERTLARFNACVNSQGVARVRDDETELNHSLLETELAGMFEIIPNASGWNLI